MMRRRSLLALPALVAGTAAPAARADTAPPGSQGSVLVLNSRDATIGVVDPVAMAETRRIPMLREPHHLAFTPDGREVMVADSGGNEMFYLDPATAEIRRREAIGNPYHLGFGPTGQEFVICSLRRGQVDIFRWDGRAPRLAHRLATPPKPSHMAFAPDGQTVFVTMQGSGQVSAIAVATGALLWTADVGPEPAGILWHNGRLLVSIMGSDHVAVLDPAQREVEGRIPVGRGAHTVWLAPGGNAIYATSRVDSRITVLDAASLRPIQVLAVPGGPDCMTFDPEGRIWVTQRWIGRIARVDPETGAVESIRVGRSPHGILFLPKRA